MLSEAGPGPNNIEDYSARERKAIQRIQLGLQLGDSLIEMVEFDAPHTLYFDQAQRSHADQIGKFSISGIPVDARLRASGFLGHIASPFAKPVAVVAVEPSVSGWLSHPCSL